MLYNHSKCNDQDQDLVPQNRRTRNHHFLAFQTPLAGTDIFVVPACGERDVVVTTTTSVRCMCVDCLRSFGFVRAITSTFIYGFQNNQDDTVVLLEE